MTRAQGHANWIRHPSLSQLWLRSTLHTLAMLVSIVARLFRFQPKTQTAECDGDPAQAPEADTVLDQLQGAATTTATTTTIAASLGEAIHPSAEAHRAQAEVLMVRTIAQSVIVDSNHEDGLTGLSHAQQQQQQQHDQRHCPEANRARITR